MEHLFSYMAGLGWVGAFLFVAFYSGATLLFIPTGILSLAGGAFFGFPLGALLVWCGASFSACGVFLAGRCLHRDWMTQKISSKKVHALDHAVASKGWKVVLLLRLASVFPFTPLNYALGLTRIRAREYVLATVFGMVPGILLTVYVGTLAGSLMRDGGREKSILEWVSAGVGVFFTFVASVFLMRLARKALSEEKA